MANLIGSAAPLHREVMGSALGAGVLALTFLTLAAPTVMDALPLAVRFLMTFVPAAIWVWRQLPAHAPHVHWGWANHVTAGRGCVLQKACHQNEQRIDLQVEARAEGRRRSLAAGDGAIQSVGQ